MEGLKEAGTEEEGHEKAYVTQQCSGSVDRDLWCCRTDEQSDRKLAQCTDTADESFLHWRADTTECADTCTPWSSCAKYLARGLHTCANDHAEHQCAAGCNDPAIARCF